MSDAAWSRVLEARETGRPTARAYLEHACDYFFETRGDRCGKDDPSIVTGLAVIQGYRLALAAHEKGCGASGRADCNFGMPNPAGFRKSQRLFTLAERLSLPLLCLVDTPGAYPGIEAEEEGQAWTISRNLASLASLRTPIIVVYIGEGGSGGALALGMGDVVLMLENANFSVISPEGCASILWRDAGRAPKAAGMLRMTSDDLHSLDLVDGIVPEPPGGASADPHAAALLLREAIAENLGWLEALPLPALLERRRMRYRGLGFYTEGTG
jgi:acetyl-CoA carboxylase carboxyl transferase alpha subunit